MTEKKPAVKSQRVSVSKRKLAQTSAEIEEAAVAAALEGRREAQQGAERLEMAGDLAATGAEVFAKGASNLTRAVDEKVMADRMEIVSDAVAIAGVTDVAEGAEILAASEDVGVLSALVGMMSMNDLEHGLELARLSGELQTTGEIVSDLKMAVLATFLTERSDSLHKMSVEQIRLAISSDGVSQVMAAAGLRINALGKIEVDEGMARLALSKAVSEKSAEMSKDSEELALQGMEEMVIASEITQAARTEAVEGAAEISTGSAVVGAALAMDDVATALKAKSE